MVDLACKADVFNEIKFYHQLFSLSFFTFTGVNCSEDVDECEDPVNTPCQNGATCVNTFQNYSCSCVPGYMGQHCETEIDECQILQPCKNGGKYDV